MDGREQSKCVMMLMLQSKCMFMWLVRLGLVRWMGWMWRRAGVCLVAQQ